MRAVRDRLTTDRTSLPGATQRPIRRGRLAAVGVLALGLVVVVTACTAAAESSSSGPSGDGFSSEMAVAPTAVAPTAVAPNAAGAPERNVAGGTAASGGGEFAPGALAAAPADGSKVIKTADLTVRLTVDPVAATDDVQADREADAAARSAAIAAAAVGARAIATTAGGFQSSADGGGSQISLAVRVPAEQYDTVVDKLAALGELTNRTESSQDVTAEVVDVNSRVESMTASVARVRTLLASATTIGDVISIESELALREANLESLQQQQAALGGQVALATVSLTLTAVTKDAVTEPVDPDTGFVAGLKSGWAALLGFFGGFAAALGVMLPFLPLIAGAGVLLWWLARLARRRSGPTATGPAPTEPTEPTEATGNDRAPGATGSQEAPQPAGVGSG